MPHRLDQNPIHLGLGAKATVEPEMTDPSWYAGYGQRHASDGIEGRLVSQYQFTASWTSWEMHPKGDEVVVCIAGELTLHQEHPDGTTTVTKLRAGEYAINAPGVWHTADVEGTATALFITAGEGTTHRPR